jgi:hypothetical protein
MEIHGTTNVKQVRKCPDRARIPAVFFCYCALFFSSRTPWVWTLQRAFPHLAQHKTQGFSVHHSRYLVNEEIVNGKFFNSRCSTVIFKQSNLSAASTRNGQKKPSVSVITRQRQDSCLVLTWCKQFLILVRFLAKIWKLLQNFITNPQTWNLTEFHHVWVALFRRSSTASLC